MNDDSLLDAGIRVDDCVIVEEHPQIASGEHVDVEHVPVDYHRHLLPFISDYFLLQASLRPIIEILSKTAIMILLLRISKLIDVYRQPLAHQEHTKSISE